MLYLLLVFVLLVIACGYSFSGKVIDKPGKSIERILEYESNHSCFDWDWYKTLEKEEVTLPSSFGYKISGEFIKNYQSAGKTIIFCHGITVSRISEVKYAKIFYTRGWNLFLYDHRGHGKSGGQTITYGYFEKNDLKTVVDYIRQRVGSVPLIGIHGESMGAAILLQYAGMEDNADFYIADCPYSNLWELLAYRMKSDFRLPVFPLMHITDLFIRWRGKFRIKDVNPVEDVKKIEKPVLFVHGQDDHYVPTKMSKEMYAAKRGLKEIYIAQGAGHAQSLQVDPEKYEKKVFEFLKKAGFTQ